jgi:hypothetical protein
VSELKLEEGWRAYERRLDSETSIRKFMGGRIRVASNWDGYSQPEALLVVGEQGLGDQIFFAGMLADLSKQVPNATVCIEPRLIPLFARSFPTLNFIEPSDIYNHSFDAQIQLGSLGRLYRKNHAELGKVSSPYLHADSTRSSQLNTQLKRENRLLCGISWDSKNADHGEGKSLSLDALLPVLTTPEVDFIDLQYGDTEKERAALKAKHGVRLYKQADIDNHDDIDGLASLIDACDIVVTVSNTTAHLAAALGKPVIVMLPNDDALFWYWLRNSVTTPWYPTVRLFRRSDTGRWEDVIDAVALTLAGIQ